MTDQTTGKMAWYRGLSGYHWLVLAVACLGWSFDTMDQWLFVFVKQHAIRELLSADALWSTLAKEAQDASIKAHVAYATFALLIGWATGGLFFGMIGDRLGRTRTMALTILLYAGFTGLSGLSQNFMQFAFFRFMTGLGVGGEFAAGAALVAETFPQHARSTALSVVQATSALGNVTAAVINMSFAKVASPETSWRWMFAVGIVPALLVFVIFLFIHEPEAWVQARARAKDIKGQVGSMWGLFSEPIIRRNTFVGVGLAAIGVVGFWGISVWTPELLRSVLNPGNLPELKAAVEHKISISGMAQNFGSFLGALGFAWVANRIGRRGAFATALIGCFVVVPSTFFLTKSFPMAVVMFFAMGFVLLFLLGGFAVYFPEIFPTRLRSTGTGFCYNVARYITAVFVLFQGAILEHMEMKTMVLIFSFVFLLGLLILPFAPETKDKPLME